MSSTSTGKWVKPRKANDFPVINPATEEPFATISLGSAADVDDAVAAARRAFPASRRPRREERLDLLTRIMGVYQKHYEEMAETISREMGAPLRLSRAAQAAAPMAHLATILEVLRTYEFEQRARHHAACAASRSACAASSRRGTGR